MKLGIVGLPNVGKSLLFNALTRSNVDSANYPFSTVEPNVGIVPVPDVRLHVLEKMYEAKQRTHATIEFVDIAGLVKGASQGQGLGNRFLSHIREVDAIVHVVRCFNDDNVVHVDGNVSPLRDIETIDLELILADAEAIERRLDKVNKALKADKSYASEAELLRRVKDRLEEGRLAKSLELSEEEASIVQGFGLLTTKPVVYVANISEEDSGDYIKQVEGYAKEHGSPVLLVRTKIEREISELSDEEQEMFIEEMGLEQSGINRLISVGYEMLGLISFLTAGPKEVRAWTIKRDTKASGAAGKIHSDIERGFIRAEVVPFEALEQAGSYTAAKEKGVVRLEGRDYPVKDGDVILFRHNT